MPMWSGVDEWMAVHRGGEDQLIADWLAAPVLE